jgi:ribosomal protein L7/L12
MPDEGRNSRRWSWPRPVRVSLAARQEADRRAGEQLVALLDEQGKAEIDDLVVRGKPVYAMRRVRELTGLRLIDAKRLVESRQG